MGSMSTNIITRDRSDLIDSLEWHRTLFLQTAVGLTEEQARLTPTVSALSIGGLIKHVATVQQMWSNFMASGPAGSGMDIDWADPDPEMIATHENSFVLLDGETLDAALGHYADVAVATGRIIAECEDLDRAYPLPEAPWFEEGVEWSVRRAATHIIAETAQHAGHADIIRETIDGAKSMG